MYILMIIYEYENITKEVLLLVSFTAGLNIISALITLNRREYIKQPDILRRIFQNIIQNLIK